MIKKLFLLFFFIISNKAVAFQFPIEISEYMDDVKVDAYISKKDISEQLSWQPFDSMPPLSIHDALNAVQSSINIDKRLSHSTLIGIELKQIPHHENFWHYLVQVKSMIEDKNQSHFYIVLMDGKVINAFREPSSIK